MPILQSHKGSWFGLPDFGITERFTSNRTAQGGSNILGGQQASYTPPQSQVLGESNAFIGPTQNIGPQLPRNTQTSGGPQVNNGQGQVDTVNQNAGDSRAQADYEFDQALSLIGQQEDAARQQYGAEEGRQTLEGTKATNRATEAKGAQLSGLQGEQQTAETSANLGMRQARDLFRQTQQQNIAQLSGLGISSSSVTEALAERLGVETARRIGGITGSLDEVKQNISKEKTRVEQVFQTKLTEIQEGTKVAIDQVRAGLSNALTQLAAERGRAATAKAQARTDIAIQARNTIQQIQLDAQNRQQAIQDAATRRAQALAEAEQFMFKPTDFAGIQGAVNNVQGITAQGFNMQPQLNYQNVGGQQFVGVQGKFVNPPKASDPNDPDEIMRQLMAQQGITQ